MLRATSQLLTLSLLFVIIGCLRLLAEPSPEVATKNAANEAMKQAVENQFLDQYSEEFSVTTLAKKKYKFRIYKVLGKEIFNFCQLLELDGRRDLFLNIFSSDLKSVPDCPACKPFIVALKKGCMPKKVRKRKKIIKIKDENGKLVKTEKIEDPVILPKKQREPSAEAVSYGAELFRKFAQDQATGPLTYQAFVEIEKLIKDPAGKTPAEIDYLKAILPYLSAVFFEYEEAEKQRISEQKKREEEETKWRFSTKK